MPPKERNKENEIQFLAEANLMPRHLARFSHASRQRVSGTPLSCDVLRASAPAHALAPSSADLLGYMRAWFNTLPMETQKLADSVTMFDAPGGAVVVRNGPDGKFVVDSFVAPAWPRLKEALDGLGNTPVQYLIDSHWYFDHTENNRAPSRRRSHGPCPPKY
jgi:hypothetical protein